MKEESTKISSNRQKKMEIVSKLSEKFGKAKAIVFTNYQGLTHKQIEGFKRAIKPLKAEYVVAKNSLLTIALNENNIKLEEGKILDGQTGTLFLYEDVMSPLKALAKTIKELNLPNVKFGIMENNFVTGEQVLKLSTLPAKEVLLAQLVGGLKAPIYGLHRTLYWNLQKFVMTLSAIAASKPTLSIAVAPVATSTPITETQPAVEPVGSPTYEPEPESILAETVEEKIAEVPDVPVTQEIAASANTQIQEVNKEETKNEGGEN